MKKIVFLIGCLLSTALASRAVVIASDSFVADAIGDAANGIYKHGGGVATAGILKNTPNLNVTAQGFSGNWVGSGYATVQPDSEINGHASIRMQSTVSAYRSLVDYSASLSNTYYFSMTVSVDTLLSASQNAYFGFANDLTSLPGEGITKYGFLMGIESDGSSMNLISRTRQSDSSPTANRLMDTVVTSISAGQEYSLIIRLDRSGTGGFVKDQFTVWIDPDDEIESNNTAALVFNDSSASAYVGFLNNDTINSFALYSGGVDAGNVANVAVDNVMMATSFDDVFENVGLEPPAPPLTDVIASDSFFAANLGDAAGGIYYAGAHRADADAVLSGVSNRNVTASGFSGDWGGGGFATVLSRLGDDGLVNLRMLGDTRAYRSLAPYSASWVDTYYFSMSVMVHHDLLPAQVAYFGFANGLGSTIPAEGLTKYGFLLGVEKTNGVLQLIARTRQSDGPSGVSLKDTVVANLDINQEYKLIVRMDRNISSTVDGLKIWVNPSDLVESNNVPALVFDETTTDSLFYGVLNQDDIDSFAFYGEGVATNIADVKIDNIMMATTYDAVFSNFDSVYSPPVLIWSSDGSNSVVSSSTLFAQTNAPFEGVANYLLFTSNLVTTAWTNIASSAGTNSVSWSIPQDGEQGFYRVITQ